MSTVSTTEIARTVARLLGRRHTRQDEVPDLMRVVHAALVRLNDPVAESEPVAPPLVAAVALGTDVALAAPPRRRPRRPRAVDIDIEPEEETVAAEPPAAAPAAPTLLRRADVVALAPASTELFALPGTPAALHGVVKWFDTRTRRGAVRLQGCSGDIAVEPALLSEMGISRLYKGQEIEAVLGGDDSQHLLRLALPGGTTPTLRSTGIVRSRQAKPVVVELKREGLRRVAARAEAEQLLRPGRSR